MPTPDDDIEAPIAVQSSTQATGTTSVILSGIAGGTSGPTAMRSLLILSLTRCAASDGSVDRTVNVLQWAIPDGRNDGESTSLDLYRGAVAGNLCLFAALLSAHAFVLSLTWRFNALWGNGTSLKNSLFKSYFPGIHAGFLSMLLPGIVTGTVHLLCSTSSPSTAMDAGIIAMGVIAVVSISAGLVVILTTQITCMFVKCPQEEVRRAVKLAPRWHAVFGSQSMWAEDADDEREGAAHHLSAYGAFFEMYRQGGHREQFFLIETGVALYLGGLSGIPNGCRGTAVSGLVGCIAFVIVVLVYQPYLSRADRWYANGTALLQALSLLLAVLALESNVNTQTASYYLNSITIYLSLGKLILDLGHAYYRTVRRKVLREYLSLFAPEQRRAKLRELQRENGGGGSTNLSTQLLVVVPKQRHRSSTISFQPVVPAGVNFESIFNDQEEEYSIPPSAAALLQPHLGEHLVRPNAEQELLMEPSLLGIDEETGSTEQSQKCARLRTSMANGLGKVG